MICGFGYNCLKLEAYNNIPTGSQLSLFQLSFYLPINAMFSACPRITKNCFPSEDPALKQVFLSSIPALSIYEIRRN